MIIRRTFLALIVLAAASTPLLAQSTSQSTNKTTATLRGTVTLGDSDKPVHNVLITVLQLKRTVDTDDNGNYEFTDLPPGKYDILAHLDRVPDVVQSVELTAGGEATLDFQIHLSGVTEQVTV